MTVLLAGATGLVGSRVLDLLLGSGIKVAAVTRRSTRKNAPGLTEVVADFAALPPLPPAKVAICALGTTIRVAGSQAAFRAVDHDAVLAFARAAQVAGVTHFILVSSVGANAASPVFYARVKGEVERDMAALGFARFDIVQPGLILGTRVDRRPAEAMFQSLAPMLNAFLFGSLAKYGAIHVDLIASAIVALSNQAGVGRSFYRNAAIRALAK
ncbi:MAG: NAD(P)H-binding protein [Polymorphobacter sp.]